jgi:hypothetical protein
MRLKQLALMRQEKLFGAHEIQRFNRDADETVAWISEKDVVLSSDDYGRDLASVQTLQVEIWVICILFPSECGIKADMLLLLCNFSVNMKVWREIWQLWKTK